MKGQRIDHCSICHSRGSGYRKIEYPFQETGYTERTGMIFLHAFERVYPPGRICWKHNYQRAAPEPEQIELFKGGTDEGLQSQSAV